MGDEVGQAVMDGSAWERFCELRLEHQRSEGARAISWKPNRSDFRRSVKAAGSFEEMLRAWEFVLTTSQGDWWRDTHGAGLAAAFWRAKTTRKFVMASQGWQPGDPERRPARSRERKMSPLDALEESVRQRKAEEARAAASGGGDGSTVLMFPNGGEIAVNDDDGEEFPF